MCNSINCRLNNSSPTRRIGVDPGKAYIIEIDQYRPEFGAHLLRGLQEPTPLNTAFVFLADDVAADFLAECTRAGRSSRERGFRVTGFDNTHIAQLLNLTSVDYQLDLVGRIAYEKLQLALDHPDRFSWSLERVNTVSIFRTSSDW
jgi:DNA-binding LacI/PurR family transcriptional regulator